MAPRKTGREQKIERRGNALLPRSRCLPKTTQTYKWNEGFILPTEPLHSFKNVHRKLLRPQNQPPDKFDYWTREKIILNISLL